jgi:hypothetical protein
MVDEWSGNDELSVLKIPSEPDYDRLRESVSNWCTEMRRVVIRTAGGGFPDRDPKLSDS